MKTILFFATLSLAIVPSMHAQDMTLKQILDKYYLAGNFEKLSTVHSIIMKGTIVQQDLMPVRIIRVRPDKYMMEFDVADLTAYQVFDGQTAWMTAPWTGNPAPQIMPAERIADMKIKADMDGILYKWKAKGHKAELVGTDTVNSLSVFKIKITRKDGGIEYQFIDGSEFMLQKRLSFRMVAGKEIPVENYFRDYRKVDGIPFAFRVETNNGGRVNEIQFDTVELDKPVDLKTFTMPEK
jgi:hypothetical protein